MGILEDIQRIDEADRGTHAAFEYGFEAVGRSEPLAPDETFGRRKTHRQTPLVPTFLFLA